MCCFPSCITSYILPSLTKIKDKKPVHWLDFDYLCLGGLDLTSVCSPFNAYNKYCMDLKASTLSHKILLVSALHKMRPLL